MAHILTIEIIVAAYHKLTLETVASETHGGHKRDDQVDEVEGV